MYHTQSWIEIRWFGLADSQEDDYVGFWKQEPSISESPIESVFNYAESGTLRTNERWDISSLLHYEFVWKNTKNSGKIKVLRLYHYPLFS